MRRMLVLAAAAALALAAAPAAVAKEITSAEVCGSGGCTAVTGEADRMALMSGGAPVASPQAAPYYGVRARMDHGDESATIRYVTVPSRNAVRYDDGAWYEMTLEQAALIKKVAAGQKPFPAAGLIGAAPPPDPKPQPVADADSPLWPEGVIIALIAIAAAAGIVRVSGRYRPASS